ncbi:MAG: DnaD domain protein [Chloroflexi bacterium]|nr:DnaD domain protein [Chloroflexota bacterium]
MAAKNGKNLVHGMEPVALPAHFFSQLLPAIDDLAELKLTIFCLAALQQKEGDYRFLRFDEFLADDQLMRGLAIIDESLTAREALQRGLDKMLARGTLLASEVNVRGEMTRYYTSADSAGRALQQRILAGEWRPSADREIELLPARPSIFGLYEDNIGVLTPMIIDALKEAEKDYPPGWIEEAMRLAVEGNKRNWRYIRAILDRWQQEGRGREKPGRRLGRRKPSRSR